MSSILYVHDPALAAGYAVRAAKALLVRITGGRGLGRDAMKRAREPDDGVECAWTSALLAVSGSVAAVKAPELAAALLHRGVSVDLVLTESAHKLLQASYRGKKPWEALQALASAFAPPDGGDMIANVEVQPSLRIHRDSDEWAGYTAVGTDTVLHVELAKRNKLLLIAPLCANTLAAAALGTCTNLLGSVLRAWYYDLEPSFAMPLVERYGAHAVERPVVVAPAMNTFMWHQRITGTHLAALEERGVRVVPPVSKKLACGDTGLGAMAEVADVVEAAVGLLREHAAAEAAATRAGLPAFIP